MPKKLSVDPTPILPPVTPEEEALTLDQVFPGGIFDDCDFREQQAILYYLQCGDKNASMRTAGYKVDNPKTENGSDNHGTRFFKRPKIAEAVERAQALLTARAGVRTEEILSGLKTDAYGDMGALYVAGTFQLKPVSEWPEELRRSVQEVTIRTMPNGDVITTVKWPDRIKAKELLGRNKRMWDSKQDQGHGSTLIIQQVVRPGLPAGTPLPTALPGITGANIPEVIDVGSFQIQRPTRLEDDTL